MKKSILFVGCGALSLQAAQLLRPRWQCYGVRRNIDALPPWIKPVQADMRKPERPADWPQRPFDYVVVALAPDARNEHAYRQLYVQSVTNLYRWMKQAGQVPQRVFFISSTAVYGQCAGERIDEDSPTLPERWSGQVLLQAEQQVRDSEVPASIVRLAGIYGGKRQAFLQRVRQGYHADGHTNRFTNRIHEQDAAALIAHLVGLDAAGAALQPVYLGVDNLPVEQAEVVHWLQEQLGVRSTVEKVLNPAGSSKRCSNARARASGWQPLYSDYRDGYAAMLTENSEQ